MIWLYIALAVVLGIPATMFVIGMFLPERYEARLVVTLDRPPEVVWAALMDYLANPITGKMRKRTEPLPDVNGLPSWKEDMGSTQMTMTTEVSTPPTLLRRRMVDSVVPMTAEWDVALEATPQGCRATASSVNIIRNGTWHVPFFRVIVGLFGGAKMGLRAYWKGVARNLGATARIE